jgi:hypothetical protein
MESSFVRRSFVIVTMLVATVSLASAPAGAASKKKAQATAQALVASYLPTPSGPGLCEIQGPQGFLAGNAYRDSCSTTDGSFRFVVLTNGNGRNFKTTAAGRVVLTDLNDICGAGGEVLITGVKGKFIEFHAGVGAGIASADASKAIAQKTYGKTHDYMSYKVCPT